MRLDRLVLPPVESLRSQVQTPNPSATSVPLILIHIIILHACRRLSSPCLGYYNRSQEWK
jgi:hypothetical protein